jgi:hypothetical protein
MDLVLVNHLEVGGAIVAIVSPQEAAQSSPPGHAFL